MMDFMQKLNPVVQALLATGFTRLMSALGTSLVFIVEKLKEKKF